MEVKSLFFMPQAGVMRKEIQPEDVAYRRRLARPRETNRLSLPHFLALDVLSHRRLTPKGGIWIGREGM